MLLAPAWDFTEDGRLHSRMAVTRGVESGLTVARTARAGRVTVSDPFGRILAERVTADDDFTTLTADLPAAPAPPSTSGSATGSPGCACCTSPLRPAAGGACAVARGRVTASDRPLHRAS